MRVGKGGGGGGGGEEEEEEEEEEEKDQAQYLQTLQKMLGRAVAARGKGRARTGGGRHGSGIIDAPRSCNCESESESENESEIEDRDLAISAKTTFLHHGSQSEQTASRRNGWIWQHACCQCCPMWPEQVNSSDPPEERYAPVESAAELTAVGFDEIETE